MAPYFGGKYGSAHRYQWLWPHGPLVSVDYVNDARSSVVDALSTLVVDETLVKVYAWYDNEWGYVSRMVDIVDLLAANGL